jgi:hypothetical protein
MQKRLLIITLLLLSLGTAKAQQPVPGEAVASQQLKQRLRSQYLHNDTAQAIITLYSRRQAGGIGWVISSLLSAVRIGTAASTTTTYGGYTTQQDNSGNMGAVFLIATPIAAYGVAKLVHYSNANLSRTLTAYGEGQPLPRSLRRKLKPRFFQEPIVKYKKVASTPIAN